ncbi:ABC transporter substrate-binding protein [Paenibacillus sp. MABNR03]|uniref:ABC transporter substrate-binding protein n=1 Tax=Paenibacillus sp. MABNR03 TaxID=3142626 RepID=UPI003D2C7D21
MKKRLALFSVLILMVGLLAACTGGGSGSNSEGTTEPSGNTAENGVKEGGTLLVGLTGDPLSFNPDGTSDDYLYPVAQNLFSRLVKINNDQQIISDLAEKWEISDDGLTYTFHLHPEATWHDGEPVTSADVKYTFEAIKENSGLAVESISGITGIETPDEHTVVITLGEPDASFLGYLAWYGTFILPEHIYSTAEWNTGTSGTPIGSGPFKFSEYTTGVNVSLERNEHYFGQVPHVDKLIFSIITDPNTMLQSFYNGELDVFGGDPPSSELQVMMQKPEVVMKSSLWPSRTYLLFNFDQEPFNKLEVRQAVAYAMNNQEILDKALKGQGQVAETFISPVYDWAIDDTYTVPEPDAAKAKALLEQAGLTPDGNGNYLNVTLDIFQYDVYQDIATVIKDQLGKVGINVTINVSDYAAWDTQVVQERKYQLSILGGYQGPDVGAITNRIGTDRPSNIMGYSNKELDQLLAEGGKLVKEDERKPKYAEVQRILSEDLPIIPISEYVGSNPVHQYVKGDPSSAEALPYTSFSEYNYVWLDN